MSYGVIGPEWVKAGYPLGVKWPNITRHGKSPAPMQTEPDSSWLRVTYMHHEKQLWIALWYRYISQISPTKTSHISASWMSYECLLWVFGKKMTMSNGTTLYWVYLPRLFCNCCAAWNYLETDSILHKNSYCKISQSLKRCEISV